MIGWIWEKNRFVCALFIHMKSVVEKGFFHEFAFDDKALKTFVEFRICRKCSNSNFMTSLILSDNQTLKTVASGPDYGPSGPWGSSDCGPLVHIFAILSLLANVIAIWLVIFRFYNVRALHPTQAIEMKFSTMFYAIWHDGHLLTSR